MHGSAGRHGVDMADIQHAYEHPLAIFDQDDDMHMIIGPDRAGHRLLEIGYVVADERLHAIVHAMPARRKYLDRM
jgi:hypothetical protein